MTYRNPRLVQITSTRITGNDGKDEIWLYAIDIKGVLWGAIVHPDEGEIHWYLEDMPGDFVKDE
jgi:hypothetical protein